MKTLSEVKDIVAKRHGYDDWLHISMLSDMDYWEREEIKASMLDEVAIDYAEQAIDRASEVAKTVMSHTFGTCHIDKQSILKVKQELK